MSEEQNNESQAVDPMAAAMAQLADTQARQNALMEQMAAERAQAAREAQMVPEPQAPPPVTDEEWLNGAVDGSIGKLVQREISRGVNQALSEYDRRALEPLRQSGRKALKAVSGKVILEKLPHYDIIKDELNGALSQLNEDHQIDPDAINTIHKLVVAENFDKIHAGLLQQEAERERNGGAMLPTGTTPGRVAAQAKDVDRDPTLKEMMDQGCLSPRAAKTVKDAGGLAAFVDKAYPGRSVRDFGMMHGWNPNE